MRNPRDRQVDGDLGLRIRVNFDNGRRLVESLERSRHDVSPWRKVGNTKMTVLSAEQFSDLSTGRIDRGHRSSRQTHGAALGRNDAFDHTSLRALPLEEGRREDDENQDETD